MADSSRITRSRRQQQQQQPSQQPRARWTTFLTKTLADILVEQVHTGNRHNNSFNKRAWQSMCDDFYNKTGLTWDKEQLKNRYGILRRQYVLMKSLLDRTDFTWNEFTGDIAANDEAWADFIKDHPDAETIKTSGCSIYKQLCTIFSEPTTTNGNHDYSSLPSLEPLSTIQEDSSSSESEEVEDVADDPDAVQPSAPGVITSHKRGRRGIDDAIADAILEMAAASKLRTAAAAKQRNARFSVASCVKELDGIGGLEERVYFAALELFNSPSARETFLSLKGDKRLTWLHRMEMEKELYLPSSNRSLADFFFESLNAESAKLIHSSAS